jgi:hypothetical protein
MIIFFPKHKHLRRNAIDHHHYYLYKKKTSKTLKFQIIDLNSKMKPLAL